jgi:hypothetical protein
MRRAEDGVGIGEAVRTYVYRRWLTEESRKYEDGHPSVLFSGMLVEAEPMAYKAP